MRKYSGIEQLEARQDHSLKVDSSSLSSAIIILIGRAVRQDAVGENQTYTKKMVRSVWITMMKRASGNDLLEAFLCDLVKKSSLVQLTLFFYIGKFSPRR